MGKINIGINLEFVRHNDKPFEWGVDKAAELGFTHVEPMVHLGRELLSEAGYLIRQNFGCSHLIVGRDHAGVGNYYGPFDAHHIFNTLWKCALETRPLKIDVTFYCKKCFGMATGKTCPHYDTDRIHISGTQQRAMLADGAPVPPEFGRSEVIESLREYYAGLGDA